LQLLLVLQP
jgi:hypothetical protein